MPYQVVSETGELAGSSEVGSIGVAAPVARLRRMAPVAARAVAPRPVAVAPPAPPPEAPPPVAVKHAPPTEAGVRELLARYGALRYKWVRLPFKHPDRIRLKREMDVMMAIIRKVQAKLAAEKREEERKAKEEKMRKLMASPAYKALQQMQTMAGRLLRGAARRRVMNLLKSEVLRLHART
jgi:hypothetical protein